MFQKDSTSRENVEEGRSGKLLRILYLLSQLRKMLQRIYLAIKYFVTSAKFYHFIFIASLAANIMLFYPLFPGWIGFGRKCFYFSDETRNWTFSQTFCTSEEAVLAQFETEEELNFLLRYKGPSDHWIGLSRESSHHVWKWTDNSKYNASIRVLSNESTLHMRWPNYWSFSFSISPSNEHPGLISFRMDWLDLLAVQGTLKSLLQYHSSKASILRLSAFFTVQLSHPYMTTGKTISLIRRTFVGKEMSLNT
ncbi:uncharacterized protein [Odocoileus virginianus]|uniref:Uncharacterized protein isoform X2 n=1 Tax=Odocoileus virginianus TaxID=9874 RepID=A0ABM4HX50_ODOVR